MSGQIKTMIGASKFKQPKPAGYGSHGSQTSVVPTPHGDFAELIASRPSDQGGGFNLRMVGCDALHALQIRDIPWL
jgi:hypothetical protein